MADPSRTASVGDGLDGLKRVGLPASAHQRPAQGLSKKDIIRCLKRFVAREIYNALIEEHRLREAHLEAA